MPPLPPGRNRVSDQRGYREVTATIAVGHGPASVSVDPETDTVYAANSGSDTVSVIGVPLSHARHNGIAITVPRLPRVQH